MENQSNNQHPEGCKCWKCQGQGACGYCKKHSCWYHALRWALGIIIILVVFWLGLSLGRLEGELGVGGRTMARHSYSGGYSRAYPAMQGGGGVMGSHLQTTQAVPSATSNQ
jgi:hypothetical protein